MPWKYKNRNAIKDGFRRKIRRDMTDAADAAATAMFDHVTSAEVMLRTSKGPGRTDTGWMADNITSFGPPARFPGKGTRYTAFFGWPTDVMNMPRSHARMTRANGFKAYFLLQERGFQHHLTGQEIPGMNSYRLAQMAFDRTMRERGW